MIRLGGVIILVGIIAILLPGVPTWVSLYGLVTVGLGCAPIFPAIIHSTPGNFGKENAAAIIGVQMAAAYVGSSVMPPIFGWMANNIGIWLFPIFMLVLLVMMIILIERLNRVVAKSEATS